MNSYENGLHSEVIDLENGDIKCHELENPKYLVESAAGGLVGGKPMIWLLWGPYNKFL